MTSDGRRMASVSSETRSRLQLGAVGEEGELVVEAPEPGVFDGVFGVAALASGRVAHVRRDFEVWLRDAGGEQRALQGDNTNRGLTSCGPDGPLLVSSWRDGESRIFRVDLDGSAPVALTPATRDSRNPTCDGESFVYSSRVGGKHALFRASLAGSEPKRLAERECFWPSLSPDGATVVALCRPDTFADQEIQLLDAESGELLGEGIAPPRGFDGMADPPLRFTPDGLGLLLVRRLDGISDLWRYELEDGTWTRLTHFSDDARIRGFDWWPDGSMVLARGQWVDDVVLLTDDSE